jgi:hypothetical protein
MANRTETQNMLNLTCAMWDDQFVYHYQELQNVPKDVPSLFLAGPSSRDDVLEFKWRPLAVHFLRLYEFKGIIVVPEPRENDWSFKATFPTEIVSWERQRLLIQVKKAVFWIPRHQTQLPGRVTNTEIGFLAGMAFADPERFKERLVWGYPTNAWKTKSENHWVHETAGIKPWHNLESMCKHVANSFK